LNNFIFIIYALSANYTYAFLDKNLIIARFFRHKYNKVEIYMIINSLATGKILTLIFICTAPTLAFPINRNNTLEGDIKEQTVQQSTLQVGTSDVVNKVKTEFIGASISQPINPPHPNLVISQATVFNQVAMIPPLDRTPVESGSIMHVIELKSIFVLLYFFAIQIDFDGDQNGDFLYVGREPERCIYRGLDTLDLILSNNTNINIQVMMRLAYEAVQIFNLISYLPHESKLRSEFRGNFGTGTQPSKTLRHAASYISLDEEFLITRLHEDYNTTSMSFERTASYVPNDLLMLINLCKKFIYKTLPIFKFYPHSPYNTEFSNELAERYQAFKANPRGMQKRATISVIRASINQDHPLYFKSTNGLTEFDDAENPEDLAGYHGVRWIKAYIKSNEMIEKNMNDIARYPYTDKFGFKTILTRLAIYLHNNNQDNETVALEEQHAHVDSVIGFLEMLIKEQFKLA
jgi:hypothetical protein